MYRNLYKLKICLLCSLVFIINGCASFYDIAVETPPPHYTKPVIIEQSFDIAGRFSIKSPSKNNYGNFTWTKDLTKEELDFNTPLGQTVAQIIIESGIATLITQDQTYSGNDLDELMEDKFGYILPMAYLHYWMQGVSLPDVPITEDLVDGFVQLGWKVEYLQWIDANHPQIVQCSKDELIIKFLISTNS